MKTGAAGHVNPIEKGFYCDMKSMDMRDDITYRTAISRYESNAQLIRGSCMKPTARVLL